MTAVAMAAAVVAVQMEREEVLFMTQAFMFVGFLAAAVFIVGMVYAHNRPPKRRR